MMSSSTTLQRRLVPRWRPIRRTLELGELASGSSSSNSAGQNRSSDLEEKLGAWLLQPSTISAGEVIESSIVVGDEARAVDAAKYILSKGDANSGLLALASLCLARADQNSGKLWLPGGGKAVWRMRTRLYANNPLAWVELSLAEALTFREREAERAMLVALSLAPENRHVLRAAARLFLHRNEFDRAHSVLLRSPATRFDPWLAAAEIATASVAGLPPRHFRDGLAMLSGDSFSDWDVSELAGALGTEELVGGRRKRARDLFKRSVADPSGNALAQMEWASPSLPADFVPPPDISKVPEPDEAVALHYFRLGQLGPVVAACEAWAAAEPYTVRPYEMASAILDQTGQYEDALKWADKGLKIRPEGSWLLNNAAFALANLDRFEEAHSYLQKLKDAAPELLTARTANYGLIAIRAGLPDRGVALYEQAIAEYRSRSESVHAAAATVFFAKAAVDAHLPIANQLLQRSRDSIRNMAVPTLSHVLENAELAYALSLDSKLDEILRIEGGNKDRVLR